MVLLLALALIVLVIAAAILGVLTFFSILGNDVEKFWYFVIGLVLDIAGIVAILIRMAHA